LQVTCAVCVVRGVCAAGAGRCIRCRWGGCDRTTDVISRSICQWLRFALIKVRTTCSWCPRGVVTYGCNTKGEECVEEPHRQPGLVSSNMSDTKTEKSSTRIDSSDKASTYEGMEWCGCVAGRWVSSRSCSTRFPHAEEASKSTEN
jgi:hypothetical protein